MSTCCKLGITNMSYLTVFRIEIQLCCCGLETAKLFLRLLFIYASKLPS